MAKPYGRKTRKKVGKILREDTRTKAFSLLEKIPEEQLIGHLFSHFYDKDPLIKFRSISAMGELGKRLAGKQMEKARVLMRRIMWNLNDESGGIGWGSPEAMGEILSKTPGLALEFKSILFSYLDPRGNFLEHGALQQGVLWGIGTYLGAEPAEMNEITKALIFSYLHSFDPIKRGYAVRALANAGSLDCSLVPENILSDSENIDIFTDWEFVSTPISQMVQVCDTRIAFA